MYNPFEHSTIDLVRIAHDIEKIMKFHKVEIVFTQNFQIEEAELLKDEFFEFVEKFRREHELDVEYDFVIVDA